MSKHMQIRVVIQPYYNNGLAQTYPKLASYLRQHDPAVEDQNPSLYELAGQLDMLLFHFDGTPLRAVLLRHKEALKNVYQTIQGHISDWDLAKADSFLYRIEDIFDQIESELD